MIPWLLGPDTQPGCSDYVDETASPALDIDVDPLLDTEEGLLSLARPEQSSTSSAPSSLMGFREDMDRRIAMVDIYYSESSKVMQRCKDDDLGQDVENPAAALLTCCKTFVDNIQSLLPPDYLYTKTEDGLDTETLLLIMSCYLAMMRLFDSVFHRIYKYLCQASPQAYLPSKVKSVLRIGGLSSLQDIPLKTYALNANNPLPQTQHLRIVAQDGPLDRETVSWAVTARTPATLFAAIATPSPFPQIQMALSAVPLATASAAAMAKVE
ncbi:hypothetical protein ACQRIU_002165 [Beauveria bassiana]